MQLYKSLKITTPAVMAFVILISLIGSRFVDKYLSESSTVDTVKEKNIELSHKITHDLEVILRFSNSVNDINDILMNYLIADINYISVYKDKKQIYQSYYNDYINNRDEFVTKNYDKVINENISVIHYNKKQNMLQTAVRYELPKNQKDIVSKNFGVIYYEYSLERDILMLQEQMDKRFLINLLWGIVLLVFIYIFIVLRFVNPIIRLSKATSSIEENRDEVNLIPYKCKVEDEIFVLFNSFNKMSESIRNSRIVLDSINKSLMLQTKEAQQSSKAKSEFLANMSHEIRTPLNAIIGFINLLQKDETDDEKKRYLSIVDSSSQTLTQIINDILDLSKIESGKLDIVKANFSLATCIRSIIDLYKVRADEKNINFIVRVPSEIPNLVNSDELRLRQIISNLLSNAIKFTPEYGEVSLKAYYIDGVLKVSILDTGIGIEESRQSKVFEPFTQASSTTTINHGGTGLGLSIVSKLVEMLDGKIYLYSEYSKGSKFTIEIPMPIASELSNEATVSIEEDFFFNAEKVLLVEDNKTNQLFATIILDELNLTYDIAENGQEAVDMFQNNDYSLILMDENMPVMNGSEAAKIILELESEGNLRHTPIIALTANALKGDREKFIELGMDDYVSKPIDTLVLSRTIGKFINRSD